MVTGWQRARCEEVRKVKSLDLEGLMKRRQEVKVSGITSLGEVFRLCSHSPSPPCLGFCQLLPLEQRETNYLTPESGFLGAGATT